MATLTRSGATRIRNPTGVLDISLEIASVSTRPVKRGGFADIYEGLWTYDSPCADVPYTEVKVAIKLVHAVNTQDTRTRRRLSREIAIWQRLSHPNVHSFCGVYNGLGELPAMVSPWCSNGDIIQYLKVHETDANLDSLKSSLLLKVLAGLSYLHDMGIVHADLKGRNILISDAGIPRLADFGLSALRHESSSFTSTTAVFGTCRWMAPELFVDEAARHSYASDMWACGCVCIEVQSGLKPYHSKRTEQQVILGISQHELPPCPPRMPGSLWRVIQACCRIRPMERATAPLALSLLHRHNVLTRVHHIIACPHDNEDPEVASLFAEVERTLDLSASDRSDTFATLSELQDSDLTTQLSQRLFILGHSGNGLSTNAYTDCFRHISAESLPNGKYPPAKLRPLARLMAAGDPELARSLMRICSTAELSKSHLLGHAVSSVVWLRDGESIAVACDSGIFVLHPSSVTAAGIMQTLAAFDGGSGVLNSIALSSDGAFLASCGTSNVLRVWNTTTWSAIHEQTIPNAKGVRTLAFCPNTTRIAAVSHDTIHIMARTATSWKLVHPPLCGHASPVESVVFSPNGSCIVSGSWDCSVRVWDSWSNTCLHLLRGHTRPVNCVAFSPDGFSIVSGSDDGTVRIWEATDGCILQVIPTHTRSVHAVAYSPDGSRIVTGDSGGELRFWNAEKGSREGDPATTSGHSDWVKSVAFSPDGKRVASGAWDGTVRVWDATEDWLRWVL